MFVVSPRPVFVLAVIFLLFLASPGHCNAYGGVRCILLAQAVVVALF